MTPKTNPFKDNQYDNDPSDLEDIAKRVIQLNQSRLNSEIDNNSRAYRSRASRFNEEQEQLSKGFTDKYDHSQLRFIRPSDQQIQRYEPNISKVFIQSHLEPDIQYHYQNSLQKQLSSNLKITDFFTSKKQKSIQQRTNDDKAELFKPQESYSKNQFIVNLMQRNQKKKKNNQELKQQIQRLNKKNEDFYKNLNNLKNAQKQYLRQHMTQTAQKVFYYNRYMNLMKRNVESVNGKLIEEINQDRLKLLKNTKQKSTKKSKKQFMTDEQSLSHVDTETLDKKNYVNQWMSKLEKHKDKIQSDKTIYNTYHKLKLIELNFDLGDAVKQLTDYVFLQAQKTCNSDWLIFNMFNLQTNKEEVFNVFKYPKFSISSKKKEIQGKLFELYKLSKKLHSTTTQYFVPTTIAMSFGKHKQYLMMGRDYNQEYQTLQNVYDKYDGFSEAIIKYITKFCVMALQDVKVKTDMSIPILPSNILFTSKFDLKLCNLMFNLLFSTSQFYHLLKQSKQYFYLPPQIKFTQDRSIYSTWSIGILVYSLSYGKFPYSYQSQAVNARDIFLLLGEINFVNKPGVSQKCKQFMKMCLITKEKNLKQLLKHPFLK